MATRSFASYASALLLLASAVVASPINDIKKREFAVKSSHRTPRKWRKQASAPQDHVLQMQIGLKQNNIDGLIRHLDEVSDPKHARYGNHLSADDVADLVRPSDETLDLVSSWLLEHGIPHNANGDWIAIEVPVHQANSLLNTEYSTFEHEESGVSLIRTSEWSLPAYLHEHIDVIEPTNTFLRPVRRTPEQQSKYHHFEAGEHVDFKPSADPANNGTGPTTCDPDLVTPGCLRAYYGTLDYEVQAADKNRMSVANYLGELSIRSDLQQYLSQFRPQAVQAAQEFELISIDNGDVRQYLTANDTDAGTGIEGALDVQSMLGIAWPTKMISYSTGGEQPGFIPSNSTPENTNEPYLAWLQYVLALGDDEIPYVVSTSYADDEQTVSPEYAKRVCDSFAQLGARGVSLFFASGDYGVGPSGDCVSNQAPYAPKFLPEFPSSCPYVTTVGGTYLFNPEVAVIDDSFRIPFTSGGGFSNLFPRPDYQKDAVAAYLSKNSLFPEYTGLYNPAGRAYPDIAAQSLNYSVIYNAELIRVAGTSASTPAVAAIMALVNDALLAAGKPTLGFLNPWIYGGGFAAFTDILSGSSAGCNGSGFPATEGWDAVTGFGTPVFGKILESLGVAQAKMEGGHHP